MPESVIQTAQIVLLGETHGVSATQELEFQMLKFLKSKIDVQVLLLEASHSHAITMNKYLNTGDTAYIDTVFPEDDQMHGTLHPAQRNHFIIQPNPVKTFAFCTLS